MMRMTPRRPGRQAGRTPPRTRHRGGQDNLASAFQRSAATPGNRPRPGAARGAPRPCGRQCAPALRPAVRRPLPARDYHARSGGYLSFRSQHRVILAGQVQHAAGCHLRDLYLSGRAGDAGAVRVAISRPCQSRGTGSSDSCGEILAAPVSRAVIVNAKRPAARRSRHSRHYVPAQASHRGRRDHAPGDDGGDAHQAPPGRVSDRPQS